MTHAKPNRIGALPRDCSLPPTRAAGQSQDRAHEEAPALPRRCAISTTAPSCGASSSGAPRFRSASIEVLKSPSRWRHGDALRRRHAHLATPDARRRAASPPSSARTTGALPRSASIFAVPQRVKRAQGIHVHIAPELGPHFVADLPRRLRVDAAVAQSPASSSRRARNFAARFAQQQSIGGHHLRRVPAPAPVPRHAPRIPVFAAAETRAPATAGIDRLERLIRQRAAEILEVPPGNAVGAADDHRVGTDEGTQAARDAAGSAPSR